ncbi:HAD family hydrolase [Marinobacter sp. W-8]|uniref:HAD family hydrolase n=1 Tax=Marinobacter sp. W-8 TaxID=3369658 RepID=UPI0037C9C4E3
MKGSYRSLYEFGEMFLGPILSVYAREVESSAEERLPVCLAREGWLFHKLFGELKADGLANFQNEPVYLKVSRTVLLRSLLGDENAWEMAFSAEFRKSTVLDLLIRRFGFSMHEAFSTLPGEILHRELELPHQAGELREWIKPYKSALAGAVKPTLEGLQESFELAGLSQPEIEPLFLDIGYSGTIQKLLTHLLKKDTTGLYFIALKAGSHNVGTFRAKMSGVFHQGIEWNQGHMLLDRSLLLESLMTAPHAQVVDVRVSPSGLKYFYGKEAPTQKFFQDLDVIFRGAIDEVKRLLAHDIYYSVSDIEDLYRVMVTTPGAIPKAAWHLFGIDDDFYGNGELNSLQVFGL